ncbi:MAG: GNAT family N-acetyltransferase [Bdellovibrionales bacterium]
MNLFTIHHLADRPEFIPVCAAWGYGEWGSQLDDSSLGLAIERFQKRSQKEHIPCTFVALAEEKPAGMISLIENNLKDTSDLSSRISSVFVHPTYRHKGFAHALLNRIEQEALRLGIETLYLHTETAEGLYKAAGFLTIEAVSTKWGPGVLMNKRLIKDT